MICKAGCRGIIIFVIMFFCSTSWAQKENGLHTVTVLGESSVQNDNIVQAKQQALQDGFRQAIIKVMGLYISTESFMENYVSIEQSLLNEEYGKTISTKTRGYIKTYKTLNTSREADSLALQLQVVVSEKPVKDDLTALGILLDAVGNPIIEVNHSNGKDANAGAVSIFTSTLAAQGFHLVDSNAGKQPDIIICLRDSTSNVNHIDNSGIYCAVVVLQATAQYPDSQRIIVSEKKMSNGCGSTERMALKQAFERAAEMLSLTIIKSFTEVWGQELTSGHDIEIKVANIEYQRIDGFTKYLARIFGIKKVIFKSFQEKEAIYFVRFAGRTSTLATLIHKMPLRYFNVSIQSVTNSLINLSINKY